jgi:hypothetical protein
VEAIAKKYKTEKKIGGSWVYEDDISDAIRNAQIIDEDEKE